MQLKNRFLALATACVLGFTAMNATAAGIWVLNNSDAGAGSFRDVIALANTDASITWIKFAPGLEPVELQSTVQYAGTQALSIDGQDGTLTAASGAAAFDLFVASGGGPLDIKSLTVAGGPANGLVVAVPAAATEDVQVGLFQVILADNAGSGLLIDDLSSAGVSLSAQQCVLSGNGTIASDIDAVRVNERGPGSITATIKDCLFEANANDAVELDEAGPGDISLQVLHSQFLANGFLDPDDLEDAIDCDEADEGDMLATLIDCVFEGNGDQGADLNEAGSGSLHALLNQVVATDNGQEGVKLGESEDGDIEVAVDNAYLVGNGYANIKKPQDGMQVEEADAGNFFLRIVSTAVTDNAKDGLNLTEGGDGNMETEIIATDLVGNKGDGVQADETGAGSFFMRIVSSIISDNTERGVKVSQEGEPAGLLRLQHVTLRDNGKGDIKADDVDVIKVGVPK